MSRLIDASVLIADDDPILRGVLSEQMLALGARRVSTAINGRAAIGLLKRDPSVQILLCDLKMPDMDGIRLLREIAQLNIPLAVIIVSGMGPKLLRAAEQIAAGHHMQVLGSLPKPPSRAALTALLARYRPPRIHTPPPPGAAAGITAADVAQALDRGELIIHVQPQIGVADGRLAGVEVLTRWREAPLRQVSPAEVIQLAEASGQIDRLTDVVMQQAAAAAAQWRRQRLAPRIGINISGLSLQNVGLPERCLDIFAAQAIRPDRLALEITETALGEEFTRSLDVTTRLHMLGFELSIDDYGTGFSNLYQLKEMPFQELKIDRAFINGLPGDREAGTIVTSSIRMARGLGLRTVAEGVETITQCAWLQEAGCDVLQGYFFSPPMPAADLALWCESRLPAQLSGTPASSPSRQFTTASKARRAV